MSPVGGRAPGEADEDDGLVRLTAADFDIDATARRAAVCPAGHEAVSEYEDEDAPERVEMHFAREVCEPCSLRPRCPVRWRRRPELGGEWSPSGAYVLSADLASTVVPGSAGSYRPVIAGAKLREGTTTILPRGRALQGVGLSSMRFHPIGGGPKTTKMDKKHGSRQETHPLLDRPEIDWPCRTRISCHHLVWTAH